MDDEKWLGRAIELARQSVELGGGPFGAVLVRDGVEIASGSNRVTLDLDPTAHAEVVAIRAATRALGNNELRGVTVYASCEPCPMCLGAALWARLDRIVFAADREDAAWAGFSDQTFRELFAGQRDDWPAAIEQRRTPEARAPFEDWLQREDRVAY
jgi:guanine deaminase